MLTVKADFSGPLSAVEALRNSLGGLRESVAEWLREVIFQSFGREESPEGVPWKPLSEPYATLKATGQVGGGPGPRKVGAVRLASLKKILELNGELFRDATNSVTIAGNTITAGSILPYAAAHQYGASINIPEIGPKNAAALRFYNPELRAIFAKRTRAHTVTIPARPYLPSPEFAEQEGAKVIEQTLQQKIDNAGMGAAGK